MKIFFSSLLIISLISTFSVNAQQYAYQRMQSPDNFADTAINQGNVQIFQDPRVDSILKMNLEYNQHQDGIMGYRVQIFFDAGNFSLERATTAARDFQTLFPADTAYISFTEPYYRVRVGDFRTRLEARAYMQKILKEYPNAFVIRDKIRFRFDEK
jgi:hypothetical protein